MYKWPKSKADRQQVPHRIAGKESMNVSADTREELEETIADHALQGWREISRRASLDGMFHAKLTR
jgi:hypothetical protein